VERKPCLRRPGEAPSSQAARSGAGPLRGAVVEDHLDQRALGDHPVDIGPAPRSGDPLEDGSALGGIVGLQLVGRLEPSLGLGPAIVLVSAAAFVGALVLLLLPETGGKPLPE
jgi:hypothetical protein